MATWAPFPFRGDYAFTATRLKKEWKALHAGDGEPLPQTAAVLKAWVRLHNGDFQAAHDAGLAAGGAGITAANKAACIYAYYLEEAEKGKLDLYLAAADRAQAQAAANPANPNAHYLRALALGRYSRGISVARALAQGLGAQVKAPRQYWLHSRSSEGAFSLSTNSSSLRSPTLITLPLPWSTTPRTA